MQRKQKLKTCSRCHTEKHINLFNKNSGKADGFHYWCRPCQSEYHAERKVKRQCVGGNENLRDDMKKLLNIQNLLVRAW